MIARIAVLCLVVATPAWMTGGCARQQETPESPVAVAPPADTSPEPTDASAVDAGEQPSGEPTDTDASGDGESLLNEKCTKCHDVERVKSHDPAEEAWSEIVPEMQEKKEGWISDDEAEAILAHLEATYEAEGS
jgi:hypothetical protein